MNRLIGSRVGRSAIGGWLPGCCFFFIGWGINPSILSSYQFSCSSLCSKKKENISFLFLFFCSLLLLTVVESTPAAALTRWHLVGRYFLAFNQTPPDDSLLPARNSQLNRHQPEEEEEEERSEIGMKKKTRQRKSGKKNQTGKRVTLIFSFGASFMLHIYI